MSKIDVVRGAMVQAMKNKEKEKKDAVVRVRFLIGIPHGNDLPLLYASKGKKATKIFPCPAGWRTSPCTSLQNLLHQKYREE